MTVCNNVGIKDVVISLLSGLYRCRRYTSVTTLMHGALVHCVCACCHNSGVCYIQLIDAGGTLLSQLMHGALVHCVCACCHNSGVCSQTRWEPSEGKSSSRNETVYYDVTWCNILILQMRMIISFILVMQLNNNNVSKLCSAPGVGG